MTALGVKVVVIGGGIGGLAVARGMALRGADVTVLEQAEAIREVGAGLQISPNGFCVLEALGLGAGLRARAVQGKAVSLRDYGGAEVLRLDLTRLPNQNYFFVHRADLIDLLAEGAREAGVKIRLLQKVDRVADADEDGRACVHMANGDQLEADLVIGADGLHSVLRPALNGPAAPFFTGQIAWRATVPSNGGRADEVRVFMGPHRHLVAYPLRGGRLINLVAVQERAAFTDESWSQSDDPIAVQQAFSDFGAEARGLLSRIDQVMLWGLFRHPVAARWHGWATALLGDAAHPTLPFMAQGACMALEDAWALVDCVMRSERLDVALPAYQARRRGRAEKVINAASGNAWKYHLSFPPLRFAAHAALRLGGAVAPDRMLKQFDWIYTHDETRVV